MQKICKGVLVLYGLYNIFLIDFDKKWFIIKVTLKKFLLLETLKERGCNFVENLYFKSCVIYKQLQPKNEIQ